MVGTAACQLLLAVRSAAAQRGRWRVRRPSQDIGGTDRRHLHDRGVEEIIVVHEFLFHFLERVVAVVLQIHHAGVLLQELLEQLIVVERGADAAEAAIRAHQVVPHAAIRAHAVVMRHR